MQIFNFLVATLKKGKGKEQEKLIKNMFYLTQLYKKYYNFNIQSK